MKKKNKRNNPCHCGSNKKYKNCHGKKTSNYNVYFIGILIGISILLWFIFYNFENNTNKEQISNFKPFAPQKNNFSKPISTQPPGPPPEGKIWSPEHNHWHDDPSFNNNSIIDQKLKNIQNKSGSSKPPGPAPEGKVWSPEHNHWHDEK